MKAQASLRKNKWKYCKSWWWWMTPRKSYSPDTKGPTYMYIHWDCDINHKTYSFKTDKIPTLRRGSEQKFPCLTKEIFDNDNPLRKGNEFFFFFPSTVIEDIKLCSACLMPRSSWPTQKILHCFYAFFVLFLHFVLLFLLLFVLISFEGLFLRVREITWKEVDSENSRV